MNLKTVAELLGADVLSSRVLGGKWRWITIPAVS
jgi:hypothetical protein